DEAVSVWDAGAGGGLRLGGGLRQVEIFVGERTENVVGQIRRTWISGPFLGRVAAFGDGQAGRRLVRILLVDDLLAAIDGDGRRQVLAEELTLIVADDDHGIGLHILKLAPQDFHRPPALGVALAPDFDSYLFGEPGRALFQKRFVIVSL